MGKGLEKLRLGDVNSIDKEELPDGSEIVTLHKFGESGVYRLKYKNDQLVEDKEVKSEPRKRDTK